MLKAKAPVVLLGLYREVTGFPLIRHLDLYDVACSPGAKMDYTL